MTQEQSQAGRVVTLRGPTVAERAAMDNYDVVDGDNGEQLPNKEMRLGQMIDEALHGIRF